MSELVDKLRRNVEEREECEICPQLVSIAADRIEQLEAALRFYADEGNWKRRGNLPVAWHDSLVSIDHGDNARQALQENTDVG